MKIYKHEGSGHYIGSCVIVSAEDYPAGYQMIREKLDSMGLRDEKADIKEVVGALESGTVILSQSGDY